MAAESVKKLDALVAQRHILMSVFTKAGHEQVAPATIQPADVFLDVIGESLRARTYVFTDPDGAELCLRPDLTVPTCRLHLARSGDPRTPAKYCYSGTAFRFQPVGVSAAHPREFRQAGIERFGDLSREAAEVETVALIVAAIEEAGLKDWTLHLGDLGLFRTVLDAAGLPPRWQRRLGEAFLKPQAFRDELKALATNPCAHAPSVPDSLLRQIDRADQAASEAVLASYLEAQGIELVGTRTLAEMAEHLMALAEDRDAAPLTRATLQLIESYVSVSGPARTAGVRIAKLLKGARNGSGAALDTYDRRLALMANAGIDLDRVTFSAEFGRDFAYYTGFVFEVRSSALDAGSPIAGGGRYDGLMLSAGADCDIPAVGAAIHTERLLAAVDGGAS
jgi:ATP phosphoribosyltransferase regulatory subunit